MATPHVAGALALFFAQNPDGSPGDARAWLLANRERASVRNPFGDDRGAIHEQGILNVSDGPAWPPDTTPPVLSIRRIPAGGTIAVAAGDPGGSGVVRVAARYCRWTERPCTWETSRAIGEDSERPFRIRWRNPPAGVWAVVVRAWDEAGNAATTPPRRVRFASEKTAAGGPEASPPSARAVNRPDRPPGSRPTPPRSG